MLCQECWVEEASVQFRYLWGGEVHEVGYCLACAQREPLSWLLAASIAVLSICSQTLSPNGASPRFK